MDPIEPAPYAQAQTERLTVPGRTALSCSAGAAAGGFVHSDNLATTTHGANPTRRGGAQHAATIRPAPSARRSAAHIGRLQAPLSSAHAYTQLALRTHAARACRKWVVHPHVPLIAPPIHPHARPARPFVLTTAYLSHALLGCKLSERRPALSHPLAPRLLTSATPERRAAHAAARHRFFKTAPTENTQRHLQSST